MLFAQKNKETFPSSSLDEKYTPKNNPFLSAPASAKKEKGNAEISNAVKFNTLYLGRGIFSFEYERRISSAFSVAVGLGSSFKKDGIMELTYIADEISEPETPFYLRDIISSSTFVSGKAASLILKLTDDYDVMNGSYYALNLRLVSNAYIINRASFNNMPIVGAKSYNLIMPSGAILYGYQTHTSGKLKTTHDVYFGVGIKMYNYPHFRIDDTYDVQTATSYSYYQRTGFNVISYSPFLMAGYNFGFGF